MRHSLHTEGTTQEGIAVTAQLKIRDENAESIGRPIFDNIIQSFVNSDREEFLQHFPYLREWMKVEIFDEVVEALSRSGEFISSDYSSHTTKKDDTHILVWKVNYKNDDNVVHWNLYLDDSQEKIMVRGFEFDR